MKYPGYIISFIFLILGAISFLVGDQTELNKSLPFTAHYTIPFLLWVTGWAIFQINFKKYKVSLLNWSAGVIFFTGLYVGSSECELYFRGHSNRFNFLFLLLPLFSVLLFFYGYRKKIANNE